MRGSRASPSASQAARPRVASSSKAVIFDFIVGSRFRAT